MTLAHHPTTAVLGILQIAVECACWGTCSMRFSGTLIDVDGICSPIGFAFGMFCLTMFLLKKHSVSWWKYGIIAFLLLVTCTVVRPFPRSNRLYTLMTADLQHMIATVGNTIQAFVAQRDTFPGGPSRYLKT